MIKRLCIKIKPEKKKTKIFGPSSDVDFGLQFINCDFIKWKNFLDCFQDWSVDLKTINETSAFGFTQIRKLPKPSTNKKKIFF